METIHGLKLLAQVLVYGTTAFVATKLFLQAVGVQVTSRPVLSKAPLASPDGGEKQKE